MPYLGKKCLMYHKDKIWPGEIGTFKTDKVINPWGFSFFMITKTKHEQQTTLLMMCYSRAVTCEYSLVFALPCVPSLSLSMWLCFVCVCWRGRGLRSSGSLLCSSHSPVRNQLINLTCFSSAHQHIVYLPLPFNHSSPDCHLSGAPFACLLATPAFHTSPHYLPTPASALPSPFLPRGPWISILYHQFHILILCGNKRLLLHLQPVCVLLLGLICVHNMMMMMMYKASGKWTKCLVKSFRDSQMEELQQVTPFFYNE